MLVDDRMYEIGVGKEMWDGWKKGVNGGKGMIIGGSGGGK